MSQMGHNETPATQHTAPLFDDIIGGAGGGVFGIWLGARLAARKRALSLVFSAVVVAVGLYVVGAAILT